jgi:hypothetical protein
MKVLSAAFLISSIISVDDCLYARIAAQEMSCPLSPQSYKDCCSLPGIDCEQSRIIKLDMSDAGCSGSISKSLEKLTQLRGL